MITTKGILSWIPGIFLCWMLFPQAHAAPIHVGASYQLLPLGDSITQGGSQGGYRPWLQQMLADGGYVTDFVGPLTYNSSYMTDKEHAGYSGYRIDQVEAELDNIMGSDTGITPQLILMMLGTNDIYENYDLASAPFRLAAMIGNIFTLAPDASLLLSTIPEMYPSYRNTLDPSVNWSGRVSNFNNSLSSIVNDYATSGYDITLLDLHGALTASDFYDGIHPADPDGYYKLAQGWYSGIQSITDPVPQSTDTPSPIPLPASLPLLIGGLATLAGFIGKRRKPRHFLR